MIKICSTNPNQQGFIELITGDYHAGQRGQVSTKNARYFLNSHGLNRFTIQFISSCLIFMPNTSQKTHVIVVRITIVRGNQIAAIAQSV